MAAPPRKRSRSAAECIATAWGWDVADVREIEYRPGRSKYPIYSDGPENYCCPPAGRQPPQDRDGDVYEWVQVGEEFGRAIYCAGGRAEELAARWRERSAVRK